MGEVGVDELRDALRTRLEPVGWELLDPECTAALEAGSGDSLARLTRPLDDSFMATAKVWGSSKRSGRLSVWRLFVGISYVPLNRLLPLLGAPQLYDLHSESVWPRLVDGSTAEPIEITTRAQLLATADELTRLVVDRSAAFAKQYASIDALVEHWSEFGELHSRGAALLTAAGRFDEARTALDTFPPEPLPERLFLDDQVSERETRRLGRQLMRWIDSDGNVAVPAEQPPPRDAPDPRSARAVVIEAWTVLTAKSAALKAVERAADGKTRDELRAMIGDELARRGVTEGPVEVERCIDGLLDPQAPRRQGIEVLRRVGRGINTAIRDRTLPDLTVPSWIAPPDRAVYAVSRNDVAPKTAVLLDEDATDWLARAHEDIPAPAGLPMGFDVWLEWDEHNATRELAVHIGERRVGTLDRPAVAAFEPVMDAAAVRDELPYTAAHLILHPEAGYILEIQLPALQRPV